MKLMNSIETLYLFVFILSLLSVIRLTFKFIKALNSTPPEPLVLSYTETITNGLFFSYIITYIITQLK